MPVDLEPLRQYRSYVDASTGVREEFVELTLDGIQSLGVVGRTTTEPPQSVGWVTSHSFGIEQMNLDRVDVTVARALAAAGFTVLRFHGPGYGDSARRGRPVDLDSQLEGLVDAVAYMSRQDGIDRVGVLGARFGGMLAAVVADRLGLPLLALWQPFVGGDQFIRDSMQTAFLTEMLEKAGGSTGGLERTLRDKDWADVNGFVLTRKAFEAVSAVDLTKDVQRFRGSALVVGISRTGAMPSEPSRVAAHLRSLGAMCHEVPIKDKWAQVFGQHQYKSLPGGETEIDTQLDVSRAIAAAAVDWALERVNPR